MSLRILVPGFGIGLALACGGSGLPPGDIQLVGPRVGQVAFEVVFRDYYTSLPAQRTVIRDAQSWQALWDAVTRGRTPKAPPPAVDFEQHLVLVAAMGSRPTGGYAIGFERIDRHEQGTVAYVTEISPGRSCITTQAFTAPTIAVKVPRDSEPVRFLERKEIHEC